MGNLPRKFSKRPAAGFTYLGLLILLAIMGIVSAAALQIGGVIHRRVAEETLLNVGSEFSRALDSYRRVTPSGEPDEPAELQELLKDSRFPGVVRHLRKLYDDPITGRQEWGVLRSEESKRIIGVFSLSGAKPIKIANFDLRFRELSGKSSYQEWVFTGAQAGTPASGEIKYTNPRDLMGDPPPTTGTNSTTIPATDSGNTIHYWNPLDLLE